MSNRNLSVSKTFLSADKIPIGSWWKIAGGGSYGYCVTAVDVKRREATVLSTTGEKRTIDTFKLQYRYSPMVPGRYEDGE